MPPKAMSPISSNDTTPRTNNGGNAETTRRRRANSKDLRLSPVTADGRHTAYPLPGSRSPVRTGISSRRRKTKFFPMRIFRWCCILALDAVIVVYAVRSLQVYLRPKLTEETAPRNESNIPAADTKSKVSSTAVPFQKSLGLPVCGPLQPDEVTFTLALQLSGNRLWMMQHHCELWGATAPISVAVWTNLGKEIVLSKLRSMGCDLDYIQLQIVSSENHSGVDYPINQLRNSALRGVSTSHVLLLDVDFWESVDLFDTLNSPAVRSALSRDPQLGLVIPAFEIHDLKCGSSTQCREKHLYWMPKDFEDLVISLGNNKSLPYDPRNFYRQGSTEYRKWMRQSQGELIDISCVSSDQYQPYMVLRSCKDLPPFQESFTGHGRNNMAWMLHLRRTGYRLQQLGGSFVTHFPHESSSAKLEWDKMPETSDISSSDMIQYLRGRTDKIFLEFKRWLEVNVDDVARIEKCEDYVDDEEAL